MVRTAEPDLIELIVMRAMYIMSELIRYYEQVNDVLERYANLMEHSSYNVFVVVKPIRRVMRTQSKIDLLSFINVYKHV
jgi:hypothetical protein